MATRKKKRTPAQERATKRMIAARKKQLRQKKKPAKKKTAKKKTARKKTAVRRMRRNPAGPVPGVPRLHYILQARTSRGKSAGYWNGIAFSATRADAVLIRHKSQAEHIARKLANRIGKSIAVIDARS